MLVFATRNQGKLVELRELLADIDVIDVAEASRRIGREIPDTIEDADTFVGNAIKKAREVSAATGWVALADDSGLEVDALGGAPGVYSARYSGTGTEGNKAKLLAALAGITQRTARFRCALALADVRGVLGAKTITADGTCEGVILEAPRGTGGFGYDPLFLLETGETMAEIDHGMKNQVSHRGKAMAAIEPALRAYLATSS